MEAVRTRHAESREEIGLPPPPAPFPTDALHLRSQTEESHLGLNGYSASDQPFIRHEATNEEVNIPSLDLAPIQRSCVHALSSLIPDSPDISSSSLPPLSFADSQLAQALTELLEVSYELETLRPRGDPDLFSSTSIGASEVKGTNGLDTLAENLHELQNSVVNKTRNGAAAGEYPAGIHPSIGVVRETLAWARADALSHAILDLVSARQHDADITSQHKTTDGYLGLNIHGHDDGPPSYAQHDDPTQPPDYQEPSSSTEKPTEKSQYSTSSDHPQNPARPENMHTELDGLATEIERFQHASPQLEDQRSAMPSKPKTKTEVQARIERNQMLELEQIWELIEQTHGRRRDVDNTRVNVEELAARREARRKMYLEGLLEHGEKTRLSDQDAKPGSVNSDLVRARDLRNRDRLLRELANSSEGGRLGDQDANPPMAETQSERKQYKQQTFLAEIAEQQDGGRYKTQDYPQTLEVRMEGKRQAFIDDLVEYSSSGRMHDQDSKPPAPKQRNMTLEDPTGLVTIQDFFKENSAPNSIGGSHGDSLQSHLPPQTVQQEEKKQGTLKKIAGLVRRSSLGLSPSNSTTDLSNVSYVAEHQENLLAVQIMLHGVNLTLKDDLMIETEKNVQSGHGVSEAVVVPKRDQIASFRITLPAPVVVGQLVQFVQSDLHLEAKLSALATTSPGANSSLNTLLSHPLSAPDLRKISPKALCCTACDREVADLSRTLRSEDRLEGSGFKDLPSEHWAEMLEVWMCHDDPAFTAQLAQRTNEGFWPTRETVLVGGSYVLVHPDEGKSASLQAEAGNNDAWAVLRCVCGEVLGKQRGKGEKYGAGTLRFSKWSIALLREEDEGESVEPVRYPLSVFIMSDLLELAQAHATYRFVITDEDASAPRLLIWLFNPSVKVSYRKADGVLPSPLRTSSSHGRWGSTTSRRPSPASEAGRDIARTVQASKILFKVLVDGHVHDFVPGFGKTRGGQVESVSYPSEVCEGLISALRESNSVYPPGARGMLGLEVGFLERL